MRLFLSLAVACTLALPLAAQQPTAPVSLTSFNAVPRDKQVLLSWNPEKPGVATYELEKSKNGSDFIAFGKVQAGDVNVHTEFIETDFMPYGGLSYYRLKLTDANGTVTYSNVVPVKYDETGNPTTPVPAQANGSRERSVLVVVRSAGGDEFYSKVEVDTAGNPIECNNPDPLLSRGVYTIVGCSEQELYAKQIVVK